MRDKVYIKRNSTYTILPTSKHKVTCLLNNCHWRTLTTEADLFVSNPPPPSHSFPQRKVFKCYKNVF